MFNITFLLHFLASISLFCPY